jgi:formate C-acetyltransferase
VIVSLQTDAPFKCAIFLCGGLRVFESGVAADPKVRDAYTKKRKTHNDGVFGACMPEIEKCSRSGIVNGPPDSCGRGRIAGDCRRVALYWVDRVLATVRRVTSCRRPTRSSSIAWTLFHKAPEVALENRTVF